MKGILTMLAMCAWLTTGCDDGSDATSGDVSPPPTLEDLGTDLPQTVDAADAGLVSEVGSDAAGDTAPSPPLDPCARRCEAFDACGASVVDACLRTCEDVEVAACEDACLAEDASCERARSCFDVITSEGAVDWNTGPYGTGYRDTVDEFVVPTVRGQWSLAANWTGQDSYMFAMTQTGFAPGEQLWASQAYWWLQQSPLNVHYFFMSYHNGDGVDDALDNIAAQKLRIDPVLANLGSDFGKPLECHWRRRIHYVTVSAWSLSGWMGEMLQQSPVLAFAIDRAQKLRPAGLLSLVNGTPQLSHLQYPPAYFNFEHERRLTAWAGETTQVVLFDDEPVNGRTTTIELPDATAMATFDTLEVDIRQYCDDHDDQNCFEWDYKANIEVLERPAQDPNLDADTPCQGEVAAVEAQGEVLGTCEDASPCTLDSDCSSGPCDGYQAAVEAVEPIAADTLPCDCVIPGAAAAVRATTKACRADGSGFSDCPCNEAWEIVRWITTYNREGRWVVDATPFLPLLDGGGETRIRFKGSYPYRTTVHFNFSNRSKPDRPVSLRKLFTGGGFGPNYSKDYPTLSLSIPASTQRAEVVAFITGHGFGGEPHNCAEFCNHTHHFTVNGTEFTKDHAFIGDYYGCAKQVGAGTVPNQYGTWTIGRGGWCPGLEVKPFIADVSGVMGTEAVIDYRGRLDGKDWVEGQPTYGGSIWMSSYLVTYE